MSAPEIILNGLFLGGFYGLFGLGAALAIGVAKIVNLAHGEFIVAFAYLGLFLVAWLPVHPLVLIPLVAIIAYGVGYVFQKGMLNRLVAPNPLPVILTTFGFSVILKNLMVELFGANSRSIKVGDLSYMSFDLFGMTLGVFPVITTGIAIVLFVVLHLIVTRTQIGRIIRATSDDAQTVQLFGVNSNKIFNLVMGIAFSMAAIAGMMLAMRTAFTPFSGVDRLLISFEVLVIGGLGSLWGAMIGGFVLGVAHVFGLSILPSSGLLFPHIVFFAVLMFLPKGLSSWKS